MNFREVPATNRRQPFQARDTRIMGGNRGVQNTILHASHDLAERAAETLMRPLVFAAVLQLPWRPQPASFLDLARWSR